jgi:hypothetical protein
MAQMVTADLAEVIARRSRPGITIWNRLEGRPRADRFDRALRAEIRDPLWMLTRQWQTGEFTGDDAGSPIDVRVAITTTQLDTYRSVSGAAERLNPTVPLESHVEPMPAVFVQAHHPVSLELRVLMGRQWLKMIAPIAPAAAAQQFVDA